MLRSAKALFTAQTGEAISKPSKQTNQLRPEHFVCEPSNLRYPATFDLSHATFKLRDISLLEAVPRGAAQMINLSGNDLTSLEIINRFQALRTVLASANSLQVGGGLVLRLPKLVELDLASNRLVAVPPLSELPQLQVLRLQRNQIARNWGELSTASGTLRELDVSHNRLAWRQPTGEFDAAMRVLGSLKKLKELRLGGNPVSDTPALRYQLLSFAPRLTRLDGLQVRAPAHDAPPATTRARHPPRRAAHDAPRARAPGVRSAPRRAPWAHRAHVPPPPSPACAAR